MNTEESEFYVGYLPRAPAQMARFTRKWVICFLGWGLALAAGAAFVLPYFGTGGFDFGHQQVFTGLFRSAVAPQISGKGGEYVLVGYGKHAVPPEICGPTGNVLAVKGTLIEREGKSLIEVISATAVKNDENLVSTPTAISLGHFTLTGEIVDSKCYFGVMNPAEGRAHRACASLCLRGGIPAVFIARDRAGAVAHLVVVGPDEKPINETFLRWIGEAIQATGEISREGKWLVFRVDPASIRLASE